MARIPWPPKSAVDITATFIDRAKAERRPGVPAVDVRDQRAPGLLLRVSPRTLSWGWKAERLGRTVRLDLGPVDRLTVAQARQVAGEATDLLRSGNGWPSATWLARRLGDLGIVRLEDVFPEVIRHDAPPAAPPRPRTWTYAKAVEAYLAAHEAEWRPAAYADARKNLRHPVLKRFVGMPVASVSVDDLATVLAAKSRTHHRQAEAIYVRLRHFFAWLASPGPRRDSGVPKNHLEDLQRPRRPRLKEGEQPRQRVRWPTMDRVGLLVALARTDLLDPRQAAAVLLLVATAQRRRAIVSARVSEFAGIEDGWGCWRLPPIRRKTGETARAQAHHAVPLPPAVWSVLQGQIEADAVYMFPGHRPRRAGAPVGHLSESTLTHLLAALPVDASPHDLRRALRSHGARALRLPDAVLDLILDHAEGVAPGSVSERHYTDDDRLDLKQPVMRAWWDLVEQHAAAAAFDLDEIRTAFLAKRAEQKGRKPREIVTPAC
ncbi:integrase family protein [Methylobacterium sp. PvR107]|uniref:tyrosine-type recombinase/integrase n=1 Tax=Methylobacterium sp. PvR107 TaxID=2806597 RepID=UPI001B466DC9|nr:integrase family protein [Methylobacterium sp. PvR107]MBP1182968.1 integrase [Methylobacterium sp. PvR107]